VEKVVVLAEHLVAIVAGVEEFVVAEVWWYSVKDIREQQTRVDVNGRML
jgi:hypothetical protein